MSVSLDNFNPTAIPQQQIDSPRSVRACKIEGLDPLSLWNKSYRDFCLDLDQSNDEKFNATQYQHYLQRQQSRLSAVQAVRNGLIRQASGGIKSPPNSPGNKSSVAYNAPLDRDKAQMAMTQKRKAAEVQARRDYEQKLLAKTKNDQEKLAADFERDRRLKEQKDQAKRAFERQKKEESDNRKRKLDEDVLERKKQLAREYEEQKQRLRENQQAAREKVRQAQIKKQEIHDRHLQFKRATQNILANQQQRIEDKRERLDALSFSKSNHISKEKFAKSLDIERYGQHRSNHMNNVLVADKNIQKERMDKYMSARDQAAQRKSANDTAKYHAMQAKRLHDDFKQKQREKNKSHAQELLHQKTNNFVEYHNQVEIKLQEKAVKNAAIAMSKSKAAYLRQRQIEEAQSRAKAKADFKRSLISEQLQAKDQKLQHLIAERERIQAEKIRVRDAVEFKKQKIQREYEQKRTMYGTNDSGFFDSTQKTNFDTFPTSPKTNFDTFPTSPMSNIQYNLNMDSAALEAFVNSEVDDNVLPSLIEFTKIPNQTPTYDSEWATNGLLDRAADHVKTWVEAQGINGLTIELIKDEGAGPLLYIEIPATKPNAQTVLMYGHMDKQPPMEGWAEGLGPYTPVLRGDRLYGRGTSDDGYSVFAGMLIIKALQKQNLEHERVVFIMESEEESGSPHLMTYINNLKPRIGKVDLVLVIDTGGGNYEQLWTDASLRGVVNIMMDVSLLKSSMHSGEGSGVVPSSFRVQRILLDRVEDSRTGRILLPELYLPLTPKIYQNAAKTVQALGEESYKSAYSKHEEVEFASPNTLELYLNNCYRPTLSITGASGLPDIPQAGNVLRTHTELKLAFRIPPGLDPEECERVIIKELTRDPPYNARVTIRRDHIGTGFLTPDFHPWLDSALQDASMQFFGKDFLFSNAGGTIPLMAQLKKLYPEAQFLVTGVLGPGSNAHCPNESINLTFLKKFICCMAFVLNKQSTSQLT